MYDDINTPYESIISLGEAFAKYRKSLKISQQRLHERTGISIFTISQFENGKGHGLSLSHFLLLMDAVGDVVAQLTDALFWCGFACFALFSF